jgi:hypothetical protein
MLTVVTESESTPAALDAASAAEAPVVAVAAGGSLIDEIVPGRQGQARTAA